MTFVPYRKPRGPRPEAERKKELEVIRVTNTVSKLLQDVAIAMDTLPKQGSIAFRDEHGKVWVVSIQASDVDLLMCEADLAQQVKP